MFRTSLGSAVSAIALASMLAGCAAPGTVRSAANRNVDQSKMGFASRALMAMNASDFAAAVGYAEQAVEKSPDDVSVRALLANSYFAAGRFASAETAYRDALKFDENQPKLLLKLVLVEIAQGKRGEALTFLAAARPILDPADYGLALALAGQAAEGIAVLDAAARVRGADARVRQNLALSHAMAGDWSSARTIAAQDVPADQLDQRIQDWMRLSNPSRPSDQIAALTGVTPAAADPGQPVRLALRTSNTAVAAAVAQPALPVPVAQAVAQPSVQLAQAVPAFATPVIAPAAASTIAAEDEPFVEVPPARAARLIAPRIKAAAVTPVAKAPLRAAAYVPRKAPIHQASYRAAGKSTAVLQLGAYGSPQRVAAAWDSAARRYTALRAYMPVSARFQSAKGIFYRLSVKGFHSPDQAKNLCISLRRSGGSCFVRSVAGDAPVQIALR
ncbi:MAG: tetratricopeptide repeat protein [Sphingomicrobium sp.]